MNPRHSATAVVCLLLSFAAAAQTTEGARNFNATNSTQVINVQQFGSGFGAKASTPSTNPVAAFFGQATAGSGFTNGMWGRSSSTAGVGVRGETLATSGNPTGVAGFSRAPNGIGVFGRNTAGTGSARAGWFQSTTSAGAIALEGDALPTYPGASGYGVIGTNGGTGGAGVFGLASNGGAGIFAEADASSGGVAGLFSSPHGADLLAGGNCFGVRGCPGSVFRVDNNGNVFASSYNTGGADFAESIKIRGERKLYQPGDLLVIDRNGKRQLALADHPYSTLVAGIYSTKPGIVASPRRMGETAKNEVPLAVVGIVPCKVSAENGPVIAGDLLVASSTPGYAMKGTNRSKMVGAVVGKALEPLSGKRGMIQVLVTLQ